jgi:hemerythrin superfamily protein
MENCSWPFLFGVASLRRFAKSHGDGLTVIFRARELHQFTGMGTVKPRQKTIDALDLLTSQHDAVERLLEQVANEPLIERKQFLFDALAATITAHATMEEKLFYPTVRAAQTQEILLETEHAAIKRSPTSR